MNFQGGFVRVWGGMSSDAHTKLVFIDGGTLTAARYIKEVMLQHVVPYAHLFGGTSC